MNPLIFKILHIAAVLGLFSSLGATLLTDAKPKIASILHGVSLLLILLLGFAILKKPPMDHYWWMAKLGLWLFLGVAPVLAKRQLLPGTAVFALSLLAGSAAAWLAIAKPF